MRACRAGTIAAVLVAGCPSVQRRASTRSRPPPVVAIPPEPCADLVAPDQPLEEGTLLSVRAGDRVGDVGAREWGVPWTREGAIVRLQVAGRSVLLVPLTWPGNGAALVLLRESSAGTCVVNVWAFAFGGNGIDIRSLAVEPASQVQAETRIKIELVGHYRGYYQDPEDESSYVAPSDEPMRRVVGTDGARAWIVEGG